MASEEEYLEYIQQLDEELKQAGKENRNLTKAQLSLFGSGLSEENLIKWQLDLREDLERIYHLLKGDQLKEDERHQQYYSPAEDDNLKPFNEFGTQLIMNIMSFYLNRNTILSNYDEDTIKEKVKDFGVEVSDLIYNRYEEIMMTTSFEKEFDKMYEYELVRFKDGKIAYIDDDGNKKILSKEMIESVNIRLEEHLLGKIKLYPIICRELVDSVHSAYNRALSGGERKSLREARTVNQTEPLGSNFNSPVVSQKQRSVFNPKSW